MPRYYFNTRIGDELISDPDGEVLRDPDRAWEMARAMIRELLKTEGTAWDVAEAISWSKACTSDSYPRDSTGRRSRSVF